MARSNSSCIGVGLIAAVLSASFPGLAGAQERVPIDLGPDEGSAPRDGPLVVDILAPAPELDDPTAAQAQECEQQQDASTLTGEIVVCRKLPIDNSDRLAGSREAWLKDYAERSKNFNTLPAPDVAGPGIFRGPATIEGLCFFPPCPKPPAVLIDVGALPPPPEGTDADRISRGLAPIGEEGELTDEARKMLQDELGLPPSQYADEEGAPGG